MLNEPYSIPVRLEVASAYQNLGYPDLALGEAYKVLLLADEILDEGEYHAEALNSAKRDIASGKAGDDAQNMKDYHRVPKQKSCPCQEILESGMYTQEEVIEAYAIKCASTCWRISAYGLSLYGRRCDLANHLHIDTHCFCQD
jgi:hypothetical protein